MSDNVKTIGIIGGGQMGGRIAQVDAVSGLNAAVYDAATGALEKAKALHGKLLNRAVEKERMTRAEADAALSRISYVDSLDALAGVDWVIEAVVEVASVKKELFSTLTRMFPDPRVVLATNTSSISITDIATAAGDEAS